MAKLKFQGSATGTGTVTLVAPTTDSTRTITLPDGDISLGVGIADNATSTAITIDSSENVGIVGVTTINVPGLGAPPATSGVTQSTGHYRRERTQGSNGVLDCGYGPGDGSHWMQVTDPTNLAGVYALNINPNGGQVRVGSGGITFNGDTAAANALDDYETGTWTPFFSSSGATWTYAAQYGSYVKVGDFVYAQFYFNATPSGTTSNAVALTNLPFVTANLGAYAQSGGAIWFSGSVDIQPLTANNASTASLWIRGGTSQATAANVSGKYLVGTLTYRAT